MLFRHRDAQEHVHFSFQFAAVLPSCDRSNFTLQGNILGKKHGTDEMCIQVPVSGYRAQVFVRAPLKYYVHIGAHAQAPNPSIKSGRGLSRLEKDLAASVNPSSVFNSWIIKFHLIMGRRRFLSSWFRTKQNRNKNGFTIVLHC